MKLTLSVYWVLKYSLKVVSSIESGKMFKYNLLYLYIYL